MKKVLTSALLGALVLTGCTSSPTSSKASTDAYPMTITHALGKTVIKNKPQRVAAVGWENGDTPLALNIAPVGISRSNYGKETKHHLHSWADEAFKKLKVNKPNVYDDTDGFDYEAIADSHPDVILAAYSGMNKEDYQKLSKIAPVIPYKTKAWSTSWRAQTIENATPLGKKKEAQALIKKTEALIAKKTAQYPKLKNKTAAFLSLSTANLSSFYIYLNNDPRAAYLKDLGFTTPKSIHKLANGSKDFSITVSSEKANQLSDVDLIVTYGKKSDLKALQKDALIGQIPAIKVGHVVFIDPSSDLAAGATPSILSIPYNLDHYLKAMNKALS